VLLLFIIFTVLFILQVHQPNKAIAEQQVNEMSSRKHFELQVHSGEPQSYVISRNVNNLKVKRFCCGFFQQRSRTSGDGEMRVFVSLNDDNPHVLARLPPLLLPRRRRRRRPVY